ncbi:hypothetical protein TH25_02150 [Thalassospira profundimaris]|uniref:Lipoprotein n=1 Tax=Thalassospira profundimaris TaxID=502049 RepID=A0A367XL34_9PROT|nr:hypothetical protein [Thalassospira profundimaris]RCK54149.1 hypothetical protein TH25_02150 [Thalassospira profundimaris]
MKKIGILSTVVTGLIFLSACSSDPRIMPNDHMQALAASFSQRDINAPLPGGWRQLDGTEISYRFANETYGIYSVTTDQEMLVMHLEDNATGSLVGLDRPRQCQWASIADRLTLDCEKFEKSWRIYTNGPDLVAADLEDETYAILKKRNTY